MSDQYLKEISAHTNRSSAPQRMFSRYADTNGNGTGTKQVTGDYSGAAEIFYLQPGAGQILHVTRMIVYIEDAGPFNMDNYGGLAGALSNGITVRVQDDSGTIINLTDGIAIDHNGSWGRVCYDINSINFGAGNDAVAVRWTFDRSGVPIRLVGDNNERLEIVVNDSFVGLVEHTFLIQGYEAK